jgi:hemoglobin
MDATLYERLGGHERIAAVVDDAVDRHAVNPVLAPRFQGKDLPTLKRLGTQFLCVRSGGPQRDEGRDLRTAYLGTRVSAEELVALTQDIVAGLNAHGMARAEVDEVIRIVLSSTDDHR